MLKLMHVRYVALFFIGSTLAWSCWPFVAQASSSLYVAQVGIGPLPMIPTLRYGTYQSALKAGDSDQQVTINVRSLQGIPILSADLSQIGFTSPTTTPVSGPGNPYHYYLNGTDYYPDYFFKFWPLTIGADVSDGLKTISVTAADAAGSIATSTVQIIVDNVPPTISLTDISFSAVPPQKGDTMYLSGSADGTGSSITIYQIRETLWDAQGNPIWPPLGGINYNKSALTAAIAASTDGSFVRVPFTLNDNSPSAITTAASVKITITAYDGSGHIVTTDLTVPIPKMPAVSNALFLPGIEGSRLYMKDAKGSERELWEPNTNSDISLLAMTDSGASVNTVYTRDIIDKVFGWHTDIYGSFSHFMDSLVASSTVGLKQWKSYPYDWRYDVFDIVDNGSLKADGSREYLINVALQMASSSPTKKVTLVAHSNGGLLAKALMMRLAQAGQASLVDKIIFVASPEVGTPKALFSLLHGYDQDYGFGFVANAATVRTAISNFAGVYGLLPSLAYFSNVQSPLANFNDESTVAKYRKVFGATLDTYDELTKFILNNPATRAAPKADDLATPLPLNKKLVDKAAATHALLDAWRPPASVAVTEIVGWGNETVSNAIYIDKTTLSCISGSVVCSTKKVAGYTSLTVIDGDETVISPSAAYLNSATYFNLGQLNTGFFTKNYKHADILSSSVLDSYIQKVLTSSSTPVSPYFSSTTPSGTGRRLVLIGAHSPVLISATDSAGRTTGIFPSPNAGSDLYITKDEIPGSNVILAGEEKYLSVPEEVSVTVRLVGTGSGTVTLDTTGADGAIVSSYENIPVVSGSTVDTTVQNDTLGALKLDLDGNGVTDLQTAGTPSVADTLALLKQRIASISSLVVRNRLVALDRGAERYAKDIRRARDMFIDMQKIVISQSGRTLPREEGDAILTLIQSLINRR